MPRDLLYHYARTYGARTDRVVGAAPSVEGLGRHFGARLYEAEVRYLVANEWAQLRRMCCTAAPSRSCT